jgi:tRNA uridine 5-carbamoylmethylation protein Kti12
MTQLIICRGLPASGKTTFARTWVSEDPATRARVNKDDLRRLMHNGVYLGYSTEYQVNLMRDTMIASLLTMGINVVSDDTNLPKLLVKDLSMIAESAGATYTIRDFTHVPIEECIRRDENRDTPIGEEAIRRLWADAEKEDASVGV